MNFSTDTNIFCTRFCLTLLASICLGGPVSARDCPAPEDRLQNVSGHHPITMDEDCEEHRVTLPIDRPGELWVEVTAAEGRPLIALLPTGTSRPEAPRFSRSAARARPGLHLPRLIRIAVDEPGDLVLAVSSEVPSRTLGSVVVHTVFRDSPPTVVGREEGGGDHGEGDGDDESPPEIIPIPDHLLPGPMCRQLRQDDVSDMSLCSRSLIAGESFRGRILGATTPDRDVFSFDLEQRSEIALEARGTFDLLLELEDAHRLPLSLDSSSGHQREDRRRLVGVLPAGRYFVVVRGRARSEGSYELSFHTNPR